MSGDSIYKREELKGIKVLSGIKRGIVVKGIVGEGLRSL